MDALRGLAALSVCWYHVAASGSLETKGWLHASAKFGWLGVDVFFVISGFGIPYALWQGGYELRDFGRYLLRRAARIEPPYFAAIILAILLWGLSSLRPGYQGRPFQLSGTQLLLHVGYLNAFLGRPWLNPDFWTLAIEFHDAAKIAGLYAAGEMVGGIFYFNYPSGAGLVSGAVFGRLAGASAARSQGLNF